MAKNQHSTNSSGVCEKIYNATASTIHRISCCPQNSIPANSSIVPNPSLSTPKSTTNTIKAAARQLPNSGEVIPIEFDPQLLLTPENHKEKTAKHQQGSFQKTGHVATVSSKIEPATTGKKAVEGDTVAPRNELVPANVSSVQEKKLKKQETMNDKFSDYITRVKHMMRSASNVGGAKIALKHDSFDRNVSNYIRRTKMKIRTTSSFGGGKRAPLNEDEEDI